MLLIGYSLLVQNVINIRSLEHAWCNKSCFHLNMLYTSLMEKYLKMVVKIVMITLPKKKDVYTGGVCYIIIQEFDWNGLAEHCSLTALLKTA